jgi:hypothetical protein
MVGGRLDAHLHAAFAIRIIIRLRQPAKNVVLGRGAFQVGFMARA